MGDSRQAWDKVGEDLTDLGQRIKRHYQDRPEQQRPAQADRRKVEDALHQLSGSLDEVFTALGDAVRDPEFGQQSKKAAASLSDALSATFAEVSERIKARQERDRPPGGDGGARA
jgi:hypothetical protein